MTKKETAKAHYGTLTDQIPYAVDRVLHAIIDALPDEPEKYEPKPCPVCGKVGCRELHRQPYSIFGPKTSGGPEPVDACTSSETATLHRLSELINKVASGDTCATLSEFRAILGPQPEPPSDWMRVYQIAMELKQLSEVRPA